jgi:MFS family permease
VLLDPALIGPDLGWRLAYLTGAGLGLVVFVMRMWIPESPRWLMIHGRPEQAHAIVDEIEQSAKGHMQDRPREALPKIKLRMRSHTPLREVARTLLATHRQRSLVGLVLMIAQAFFYNAIFFTFALVLTDFFGIPANHVGWYILPFAAGNFGGAEAMDDDWSAELKVFKDYHDCFARTSPVGSFLPNHLGIFDLEGNVSEWCEDYYNSSATTTNLVLGANWASGERRFLEARYVRKERRSRGDVRYGFRCVLESR